MEKGTKFVITPKDESHGTNRGGNTKAIEPITVEWIDTIRDIRNISNPDKESQYPVVTKYLVSDIRDNSVFSIYTHQIRKIIRPK